MIGVVVISCAMDQTGVSMKKIVIMVAILFSITVFGSTIDLYGDKDEEKVKTLIQKQSKALESLSKLRIKAMNRMEDKSILKKFTRLKAEIAQRIKKEGDYLYVDIDHIYYPHLKTQYTTIEVIKKEDAERMRFASKEGLEEESLTRVVQKHDLIEDMISYKEKAIQLITQNKIPYFVPNCPFFHCITDFKHPDLKPFLTQFQQAAESIAEKRAVVLALKGDKDRERRGAAALLVGHFKQEEEIITTLQPYVLDEDVEVRNNVIRVLLLTMIKSQKTPKDIRPFLQLLDSPSVTDRNKSLFLLLQAIQNKAAKRLVRQEAAKKLVDLLALKQPNNHDPAYEILKQISGKHFADTDLLAWNHWAMGLKG